MEEKWKKMKKAELSLLVMDVIYFGGTVLTQDGIFGNGRRWDVACYATEWTTLGPDQIRRNGHTKERALDDARA